MTSEQSVRLTSAELGFLWDSDISESMSVCLFKYFLQNIDDQNIKALVDNVLNFSMQNASETKKIFGTKDTQVPWFERPPLSTYRDQG